MLSFTHTLVSLPFGVYFHNPLIIFLGAFIWHLFCDTLLHWNIFPPLFKKYPYGLVALDIIAGLVAAWVVVGNSLFALPMLAAIAGGNAPDVCHGLWDWLNERQRRALAWARPFFYFHEKLQLETSSWFWGITSQTLLILISLGLVLL